MCVCLIVHILHQSEVHGLSLQLQFSACLRVCLPACLPACLSVCLSVSVCMHACLSVRPSACLPVCLPILSLTLCEVSCLGTPLDSYFICIEINIFCLCFCYRMSDCAPYCAVPQLFCCAGLVCSLSLPPPPPPPPNFPRWTRNNLLRKKKKGRQQKHGQMDKRKGQTE